MKGQTTKISANGPHLRRELLSALLAGSLLVGMTLPAHAQIAQSGTMVYGIARMVPQMGSMLVRGVARGHKNKNNSNNNNNNPNNTAASNGVNPNGAPGLNYGVQSAQGYPGAGGQYNQGYMTPGQPGYANMQSQGYAMQNGQPQMNANAPGSNYGMQSAQGSYGTLQGQMYGANAQGAYGGMQPQGGSIPYGPAPGQ